MRRQGAHGVAGGPQAFSGALEVELDGGHRLALRDQRVEAAVLFLVELGRGGAGQFNGIPAGRRRGPAPGAVAAAAEGAGGQQDAGTDECQNQDGDEQGFHVLQPIYIILGGQKI